MGAASGSSSSKGLDIAPGRCPCNHSAQLRTSTSWNGPPCRRATPISSDRQMGTLASATPCRLHSSSSARAYPITSRRPTLARRFCASNARLASSAIKRILCVGLIKIAAQLANGPTRPICNDPAIWHEANWSAARVSTIRASPLCSCSSWVAVSCFSCNGSGKIESFLFL